MGCFFTWICRLSWYTDLQRRVGGSVGILCAVIKITTSPSLIVYKTAAYARCLGGKRLQRTCASQLGDDGWEKRVHSFFSSAAPTGSHVMSERSAEGVLIVLTHGVDTSVLIFQGERPVTLLCGGRNAQLHMLRIDKLMILAWLTRIWLCPCPMKCNPGSYQCSVITGEGLGFITARRHLGWI